MAAAAGGAYESDVSDGSEDDMLFSNEAEAVFQHEQYYFVMGEEERAKLHEAERAQRVKAGREAQAASRVEQRRKEEEERLVALGKRNVVVLVADGVDEVMLATVVHVLRTADVNVVVAAVTSVSMLRPPTLDVTSSTGMKITADVNFDLTGNHNFQLFNAVIVPATTNLGAIAGHKKAMALLRTLNYKEKFVCGAGGVPGFVFAQTGGFVAKRAVTGDSTSARFLLSRVAAYNSALDPVPTDTPDQHPSVHTAAANRPETPPQPQATKCKAFLPDQAVVVDYNIVTCRAQQDSMEFALVIVKCIFGSMQLALRLAAKLGAAEFETKYGAPPRAGQGETTTTTSTTGNGAKAEARSSEKNETSESNQQQHSPDATTAGPSSNDDE